MKQRQTPVEENLVILIHGEIGTKRRLGQSVYICSILSREPLSLRLKGRRFCQVSTQDKFHWTKAWDDKKRGFKKKCGCKCVSRPFPSSFPSFTAACSQKKETKMNKTKLKAIIVWEQSSYLHDSVCLLLPYGPQIKSFIRTLLHQNPRGSIPFSAAVRWKPNRLKRWKKNTTRSLLKRTEF